MQNLRALAIRIVSLAMVCGAFSALSYPQASGSGERQPTLGIYIPPNEQHPAVALPIYRKSNHGVYLSVGTERSFIGAALTRAQALFVIDYDSQAVQFANINRALLAASTDRHDYVELRLHAPQDVWRQRAQLLTGEDKATLSNPDSWTFWDRKVRKNLWAWNNAFQHFNTEPKVDSDPFFASDYLFDDVLYSHLSGLARHSMIWARVIDLRHPSEVRAICAELKSRGLPLGVVDTSDVPNPSEAGTSAAAHYVELLSKCAEDTTIFLNTAPGKKIGVSWSYFAFTNRTIRGRDTTTVERWYGIELNKIRASEETLALLDDPDAIAH